MSAVQKCPRCGGALTAAPGDPARRACPRCGARFVVKPKQAAATVSPAKTPPPAPLPEPNPGAGPGSRLRRLLLAGGLLAALFLLTLAAAAVLIVALWPRGDAQAVAIVPLAEGPTPPPAATEVKRDTEVKPAPEVKPVPPAPRPYAPSPEVNRAIERGVALLKATTVGPLTNLPVPENEQKLSISALLALTLLECGVLPDDPVLAKAVTFVRQGVPALDTTYGMSVTLLMLDRLGAAQDEPAIRRLALQLAAAQTVKGGWSYSARQLTPKQLDELQPLLASEAAPAGGDPALAKLPVVRYRRGQFASLSKDNPPTDDNSNTQFAALALWVARKHRVPVDRALAFAGARFQAFQEPEGPWHYNSQWPNLTGDHRDAMTCAGLLGLAVGRAVDADDEQKPGLATDARAEKALRFLSGTLRRTAAEPVPNPQRPHDQPIGSLSQDDLYYLWSLERVGVLYDLKTIGGVDWHTWGTKLLLAVQNPNGSWSSSFGETVGTCFALLFLKRVNVAKDLTARLQRLGRVKDPLPERTKPSSPQETSPAAPKP